MTFEATIAKLREEAPRRSAVGLAELLGELTSSRPTQSGIIFHFSRAFPEIPLRTLIEAGAWSRVSGGGMSDQEFDDLLRPWLGAERVKEEKPNQPPEPTR